MEGKVKNTELRRVAVPVPFGKHDPRLWLLSLLTTFSVEPWVLPCCVITASKEIPGLHRRHRLLRSVAFDHFLRSRYIDSTFLLLRTVQNDLQAISRESEMRSEFCEAEGELCQLDDLLAALPDTSGELVSEREDVESKISSPRIEFAPHNKLPPELLAEIFLLYSPPTVVALPPRPDDPLLTLTQICRAWRELALRIPEFWASISVTFTEEHNNVEHLTELSAQWLSRVGNGYRLSITAECARTYGAATCEDPSLVAPFVSMVVSHAHQLRYLHLAFPMAALLPLFELAQGAFPGIETLWLRPLIPLEDPNNSCWLIWPSSSLAFASAPLVREISFCPIPLFTIPDLENHSADGTIDRVFSPAGDGDVEHSFSAPTFLLPWSQLRVLRFPLTALTAEVWCTILVQCAKLEDFYAAVEPLLADAPGSPIHLPHLTYLYVAAYNGGGEQLINRLVAPSLHMFSIMGRPFPTACLTDFQGRSGFALKTFMPSVVIPGDDVVFLFQQFSNLTCLIIQPVSTENFPALFWERLGRGDLLPQLKMLTIRPTATQTALLVDMLASRWDAAEEGRVPILEISFCDVRPAHLPIIIEELRRLEKYALAERIDFVSST
ncbi:F-box domain-containing protein [Mycena sanguinolenta]|uniref:F-box domain-containing protein n=1 Tax=Mycena sanguinolenta TaxID=230812 RepID=A0A8H6XXC0_9AGAR|nr:F-box domain-containing protein [Mycena sanguinolenta]